MQRPLYVLVTSLCLLLIACGPSSHRGSCTGADCNAGSCSAGDSRQCYPGLASTEGVGPCVGGNQSCTSAGQWGDCVGAVLPVAENCSDGIDNNCNGMVDENIDADGDGFSTCPGVAGGGDCCDSTECSNPAAVNPGAFDVPGDGVDNDCDGTPDNTALLCDQGLMSNSLMGMDFAKAIDICQTATMNDKKWGVISAALTLPDGTGVPDPVSHSIRAHFGTNVLPQGGVNLALLSSGAAAGKGDANPAYHDWISYTSSLSSPIPADFLAANGGNLPNAPGCPAPLDGAANDPVMLTLSIRVPTNAHSFSIKSNFFSAEFPEFTCTFFNDFFVILLDSSYAGTPANPPDKNLAFYTQPGTMMKFPVGVNLAFGNTGLFTQCMNGSTGCSGQAPGMISTCVSTQQLAQTGFDDPSPSDCDSNSLKGGGTGWLTTSGNVRPGEIMKLRIAIWDTSDHLWDSLAAIDAFSWSADGSDPGTVILKTDQPNNPMAVESVRVPLQSSSLLQP
ncbi:MAG: hypothetical protein JWO36_1836 [Myxococcales bacterium]|nr:hypothetical protein [Myxococcales bacterium]